MKVGDYARLQNSLYGTVVIYKIMEILENTILTENDGSIYEGEYSKEEIIKSSSNIIDLIEVGDYVNGHLVFDKAPNCVYIEDNQNKMAHIPYVNDDIKSVLTKEQFKSIKYKIGE